MSGFSVDAIDHIELYIEDQAKSVKWYNEIFGFKIIKEFEFWSKSEEGPLFVGNTENNVKLALFKGTRANDGSIRRIAFRVSGKNFLSFLGKLSDSPVFPFGKKIPKDNVVDHEISYSIYFNDPDGNKLELTSYDYDLLHKHFSS